MCTLLGKYLSWHWKRKFEKLPVGYLNCNVAYQVANSSSRIGPHTVSIRDIWKELTIFCRINRDVDQWKFLGKTSQERSNTFCDEGLRPTFQKRCSAAPWSNPWEHATNCENQERLGLKMSSCYYHWILHLSIRSWPSAATVWIPQDLETKLAVRRLNHDWTTGVVSSS